jgi:CRISPR-associated protein Cas2
MAKRSKSKTPPLSPLGWRTMWVIAMYDLPIDGFSMMQYSVYQRHCASTENADVHIGRIHSALPPEGEVRILVITDKQFEKIVTFWGKDRQPELKSPAQLEFF